MSTYIGGGMFEFPKQVDEGSTLPLMPDDVEKSDLAVILLPGLPIPDDAEYDCLSVEGLGTCDDWWDLIDCLRTTRTGVYGVDPRGLRDLLALRFVAVGGRTLAPVKKRDLLAPCVVPDVEDPGFWDQLDEHLCCVVANLMTLQASYGASMIVVQIDQLSRLLDVPDWDHHPDARAVTDLLVGKLDAVAEEHILVFDGDDELGKTTTETIEEVAAQCLERLSW